MKRFMLLTLLAMGALVVFTPFAGAQETAASKGKLIINELKATGVDDNTVATLGDVLCSHVASKTTDYDTMCAQDAKVILQSKNNEVLLGGCDDEKCLAEVGNILQAKLVLTGSIGTVGKKFVINLSLLDVEKGQTVARATHDVASLEDMLDGIKSAADKLIKNIKK